MAPKILYVLRNYKNNAKPIKANFMYFYFQ